jgi:hypothetical protein
MPQSVTHVLNQHCYRCPEPVPSGLKRQASSPCERAAPAALAGPLDRRGHPPGTCSPGAARRGGGGMRGGRARRLNTLHSVRRGSPDPAANSHFAPLPASWGLGGAHSPGANSPKEPPPTRTQQLVAIPRAGLARQHGWHRPEVCVFLSLLAPGGTGRSDVPRKTRRRWRRG